TAPQLTGLEGVAACGSLSIALNPRGFQAPRSFRCRFNAGASGADPGMCPQPERRALRRPNGSSGVRLLEPTPGVEPGTASLGVPRCVAHRRGDDRLHDRRGVGAQLVDAAPPLERADGE